LSREPRVRNETCNRFPESHKLEEKDLLSKEVVKQKLATLIHRYMRFSFRNHGRTLQPAVGLALVASVACSHGVDDACFVVSLDPLFTITSATNAVTNEPIPQVRISALRVGTVPISVAYLSEVSVAHDVTIEGDQLVCVIDCGFAATPGTYTFTVSSAGYRDTTMTIAADYSRADYSCPVKLSGGLELNLTLSPL
jgi:hypothetical protein